MNNPHPPGLLGVSQVADMLGVKPGTVHNYTNRGTIPPPDYRVEGTPIWKEDTIRRWKEARTWTGKNPST